MTTGQILGQSVLLKVDTNPGGAPSYTAIGLQKNATLTMSGDTIDVSNKDSDRWREFIPGYKEWSLECDAMLVESDVGLEQLQTRYLGGLDVKVAIATPAGATHYTGLTIVKSLKYTSPDSGVYTAAISLQGTGTLTHT